MTKICIECWEKYKTGYTFLSRRAGEEITCCNRDCANRYENKEREYVCLNYGCVKALSPLVRVKDCICKKPKSHTMS